MNVSMHTHTHSQLVQCMFCVIALLLVTFPIVHGKLFSMLVNSCVSYCCLLDNHRASLTYNSKDSCLEMGAGRLSLAGLAGMFVGPLTVSQSRMASAGTSRYLLNNPRVGLEVEGSGRS